MSKPYEKPEVVHEGNLEVRAGSPDNSNEPNLLDPLDNSK
jgi:hypothetical protein